MTCDYDSEFYIPSPLNEYIQQRTQELIEEDSEHLSCEEIFWVFMRWNWLSDEGDVV